MWALVIIVILIIVALLLILAANGTTSLPPTTSQTPTTTETVEAKYTCDNGKTIDATYLNATTSTTTGNTVQIVLSDGRQMTLAQTISADGARYADQGESFVFWSKGNGAFVQEGASTTYNNCVEQGS
jgi:membrane-bound inhibitor of C-type lysozyme